MSPYPLACRVPRCTCAYRDGNSGAGLSALGRNKWRSGWLPEHDQPVERDAGRMNSYGAVGVSLVETGCAFYQKLAENAPCFSGGSSHFDMQICYRSRIGTA